MGPAMTIATVLLAVAKSVAPAIAAIPIWAPFLDFTLFFTRLIIYSIPPFSLISPNTAPTVIEITVISNMEAIPSPITVKISRNAKSP